MRVAIFLPEYAPVSHAGQTPVAYKRTAVDKFQRFLAERAKDIFIIPVQRLDLEAERGELFLRRFQAYTFTVKDATVAGEIIAKALDAFTLKSVFADGIVGDDRIDANKAADMIAGLD